MEHIIKQLALINLEPAQHELVPLKTGEPSLELYKARQELPIKQSNLQDLEATLRLIMLKVGIRANNLPEDEERDVLINHIIDNYGEHSLRELLLSFEMGIAGKIEVKMDTYENFSCLYVSSVMNAYRVWARKEIKHIEGTYHQTLIKEMSTPPPQDRDKTMDEWMEETRKGVNEGTIEWNFLPITLYDYMVQKELFLPTKEYKHEILKQAVEKRQAMIEPATPQMSAFLRMKENKVFQEEEAAIIRGMCKKLTLFDYLWNL